MKSIWYPWIPFILFLLIGCMSWTFASASEALAQQPTPSSSSGMYITVVTDELQINVRMGPSSSIYPIVGVLPTGSIVPALGRSQGGDWIQIEFPGAPDNKGWVYSPLVQVSPGALQVAAPPPTPPQPATSTLDPTLVAQFRVEPTATRLPTFTPPPSIPREIFTPPVARSTTSSVPVAGLILAFAFLGFFGFTLSLFRRKKH